MIANTESLDFIDILLLLGILVSFIIFAVAMWIIRKEIKNKTLKNPRTKMMTRRELNLNSIDEIIAEVGRLQSGGYEKAGNWDLQQICDHLSYYVRGTLEGFSEKAPWLVRMFTGRRRLKKLLRGEPIPAGIPIPEKLIPLAGGDEGKAAAQLQGLLERLKTQTKVYPSPLFGTLTKEQWLKLHTLHCNHHLSFLAPKD